jgi:uncharacterized protein YwqG
MTDRRGFFKELLREAAGVAQELSAAMQGATDAARGRPPIAWARPATAEVAEETLLALCDEVGLTHRADDVRRFALAGFRLTRGDATARSRLGGAPELPPEFAWPSWSGRELDFVAQVDLAEVATADPGTILPRDGLMLFFYDLGERPSGLWPTHRDSCRVVVVDGDLAADESRGAALPATPLRISRELMLPGGWSFQTEELDLTLEERDSWDDLRDRLAVAQGIELEDASVPHRLLGYHEELGREVEVDCALASAGFDAEDVEVYYAHRQECETEARRWRLLLQLTAEDSDRFERLYIWVPGDELQAGTFDGAWAVCRRE